MVCLLSICSHDLNVWASDALPGCLGVSHWELRRLQDPWAFPSRLLPLSKAAERLG